MNRSNFRNDVIHKYYVEELIEELEDAEDIADIEARNDEPTVSHEYVVAKYEAKYGPLYYNVIPGIFLTMW